MKKVVVVVVLISTLSACSLFQTPPDPAATCSAIQEIAGQAQQLVNTVDPKTKLVVQNLIQNASVCQDVGTLSASIGKNGAAGVNNFLMTVAKDFGQVLPTLLPLIVQLLPLVATL